MKLLYLIHVDWNWIFQRPQIIELQLEKDFNCTVINRKFLLKKELKNKNPYPQKMINIYQFPKEYKFKLIKCINKIIFKLCVRNIKSYDYIWITSPLLYDLIPYNYKGKVIYDCMDNHVSMASNYMKKKISEQEKKLINRADYIFASSIKLIETIPGLSNAHLLRNGYIYQEPKPVQVPKKKETYVISYFGTISSWFDFQLLEHSCKKFQNIEYHLIGPEEKALAINKNQLSSNIIFEGVVQHDKLYKKISNDDALIMPFKINDIILSVDPVKLYEYICFGKCIISVWYPEIDRFEPFVYFYRNEQEYFDLLSDLSIKGFPAKYDTLQQKNFLYKNTWDKRYDQIMHVLKNTKDD